MFIVKKTTTRKDDLVQVELVMKNIPFTFIGHANIDGIDEENIIAFETAEKLAFYNATKGYRDFLRVKGVDHVEYNKRNKQNSTEHS